MNGVFLVLNFVMRLTVLSRAEVHITYKCDLQCLYCNRGCFSGIEFAPDMTIEQFKDFIEEVKKTNFGLKEIVIIGGEPTLHSDCIKFIEIANEYTKSVEGITMLYSNNYSPKAKDIISYVKDRNLCYVADFSFKTHSENHAKNIDDFVVFISPEDINKKRTEICGAYLYCGFSVDSLGYTLCSLGGMISSVL